MSRHGRTAPQLDVDDLPPDVRAAIDDAIAGDSIMLTRSGVTIGSMAFVADVLQGTVIERPHEPEPVASVPDGVTVIATTMTLSEAACRRLSEELGPAYLVLDIHSAPTSTDVVLTHPVSPQLLAMLRQQFPKARVMVTEIEDDELGVRYSGPVSRLLDAGASAYLPPRPIAELAANVHAYLTQGEVPKIEAADQASRKLPAPRIQP